MGGPKIEIPVASRVIFEAQIEWPGSFTGTAQNKT